MTCTSQTVCNPIQVPPCNHQSSADACTAEARTSHTRAKNPAQHYKTNSQPSAANTFYAAGRVWATLKDSHCTTTTQHASSNTSKAVTPCLNCRSGHMWPASNHSSALAACGIVDRDCSGQIQPTSDRGAAASTNKLCLKRPRFMPQSACANVHRRQLKMYCGAAAQQHLQAGVGGRVQPSAIT